MPDPRLPESNSPTLHPHDPPTLGDCYGFEIYPMPFFALLAASDPVGLTRWYEDALGFAVLQIGPAFHLRRHKFQDLLIVPASSERTPTSFGPLLYFDADGELEGLAERIKQAAKPGTTAVSGPVTTPWNTCELRVTDPVGHRIVFTSRTIEPDPEIQARTKVLLATARRP